MRSRRVRIVSECPNPVFPRVFPRIFISFYSSHPSGRRRRRFGAILFTRRENIPTRTPRRVSFAVDSPSVTDVIDFSRWFRHTSTRRAVRKGARSVCLSAECFFVKRPSFAFDDPTCLRASRRDATRRPRADRRRDVDGRARQSEKTPETIFRAPTRARARDRCRKR